MLQIALVGAPKPPGWSHPQVRFDPEIPLDRCDALLAWDGLPPEFFSFRGPRAWYISEALAFIKMFRQSARRRAYRILAKHEFLHHSNPNPKYRFPAVTHYGDLTPLPDGPRPGNIVATVNAHGNRIWWLRPDVRRRTNFILHPKIDLYGRRDSWDRFRRWPWSKPGPPANYRGPTDAPNCWDRKFPEWLSRFRVNVCLENSYAPYWFTEKFVNTALAGCVPVYRAHPTVRDTYLKGARWIDPSDYNFDWSATLAAADACDAEAIRQQNYQWLKSGPLKTTEGYAIWTRIADYFVERLHTSHSPALESHAFNL